MFSAIFCIKKTFRPFRHEKPFFYYTIYHVRKFFSEKRKTLRILNISEKNFLLYVVSGKSSPKKKKNTSYFQNANKVILMPRKGSGNEACPEWNPQAEFTSAEENCAFQGLPMERIRLFFCPKQVEILIST